MKTFKRDYVDGAELRNAETVQEYGSGVRHYAPLRQAARRHRDEGGQAGRREALR